jgi:hypothetical protein
MRAEDRIVIESDSCYPEGDSNPRPPCLTVRACRINWGRWKGGISPDRCTTQPLSCIRWELKSCFGLYTAQWVAGDVEVDDH